MDRHHSFINVITPPNTATPRDGALILRDWSSVQNNPVLCPPPRPPPAPSDFPKDRLSFAQLERLTSNDFKQVDFSLLSIDIIDKLGPIHFQAKGKSCQWTTPPPSMCFSFKLLRQWGRTSSDARIQFVSTKQQPSSCYKRKEFNKENENDNIQEDNSNIKRHRSDDQEAHPITPCCGISFEIMSVRTRDPIMLVMGFKRIVADALHQRSSAFANDLPWPVNDVVFPGAIYSGHSNTVRMLLKHNGNSNFGFVSVDCSGSAQLDSGPCKACSLEHSIRFLKEKCLYTPESVLRPTNLDTTRLDLIHSPTLLRMRSRQLSSKIHNLQMKSSYLSAQLTKVRETVRNEPEMELSPALKESLVIDHPAELYSDEIKTIWNEALNGETIERQALAKALFDECQVHAQRSKVSGKQSVRFSKNLMAWAIQMRVKMGSGSYSFAAQAMGLPSDATVKRAMNAQASSSSVAVNGGICYHSIHMMCEQVEQSYPNETIPLQSPRRAVSIAYDTTSCMENLEVSDSSGQIVGCAFDDDDGKNAFQATLDSLADIFEVGEQDTESDQDAEPPLQFKKAKHFGVFIATTMDKKGKRILRTVARHAIHAVSHDFLCNVVEEVVLALFNKQLIVVTIGMDGAVENRLWCKWIATHTVDDLINLGILPIEWKSDSLLPTSQKIGFVHPCFHEADNVFIVFTPDMPHLMKKIVNAMEYTGNPDKKRDLEIAGRKISLSMIQECYDRSEGPGRLRTTRLSEDHFDKNCNSRMRTYLAVQILSQRTEAMVGDSLESDEEMDAYSELRKFLLLFDRVVDIMNAHNKGHDGIDGKDHKDLKHLLDVVRYVEKWRQEVEAKANESDINQSNKFLPFTTYEDLVWMTFGVAYLVHKYCGDTQSTYFKIDLGGFGSDCCEYRFGNLKHRYTNRLTIKNANYGTFASECINAQPFNAKNCGNTSGNKLLKTAGFSTDGY
jgi:hypothetical protein